MSTILDRLDALDRALVSARWPATSPWWRETLGTFVASHRRQLVCRVGRRGGKSSTLCRFAVAFALSYDVSQIPPGDVGVIAFVSTTRDEASQRLRTIKAILDSLQVGYRPIEGGIEIAGRPIVCKVYPCTVAGVSGFTSILVIADEVAKWHDADSGVNPASEVLGALRPTMATQPGARIVLSSSPLGSQDAHAKAFDVGDDEYQCVAYAPTWVANPTIAEDATRRLEREPRVWTREYAAIPAAGACAIWSAAMVDAAFATRDHQMDLLGAPVVLTDPSGLRHDAWTAGVAYWGRRIVSGDDRIEWEPWIGADGVQRRGAGNVPAMRPKRDEDGHIVLREIDPGPSTLCIRALHAWPKGSLVTIDHIGRGLANVAQEWDAAGVATDQYGSFGLAGTVNRYGVECFDYSHSSRSKEEGVEYISRLLREGRVHIAGPAPWAETMRAEMLSFEERIGKGSVRFEGRRHDDFVSLLLLAHRAEEAGILRGGGHGPAQGSRQLGPAGNNY